MFLGVISSCQGAHTGRRAGTVRPLFATSRLTSWQVPTVEVAAVLSHASVSQQSEVAAQPARVELMHCLHWVAARENAGLDVHCQHARCAPCLPQSSDKRPRRAARLRYSLCDMCQAAWQCWCARILSRCNTGQCWRSQTDPGSHTAAQECTQCGSQKRNQRGPAAPLPLALATFFEGSSGSRPWAAPTAASLPSGSCPVPK